MPNSLEIEQILNKFIVMTTLVSDIQTTYSNLEILLFFSIFIVNLYVSVDAIVIVHNVEFCLKSSPNI